MQFEVELKFHVNGFTDVESRLQDLKAEIGQAHDQVDCYFAHPARDFSVTDEAFRIRSDGDRNSVTYKGPRIDQTTKTRRELELPLPAGPAYGGEFTSLLELLGFRPVAEVHKQRRKVFVDWEGSRIELSLDDVQAVGTFVELELIADESTLEAAKKRLHSLANHLSLTRSERRSYLCLLLEANAARQ